MAAEVINLIVPGVSAFSSLTVMQKIKASEESIQRLSQALERWASMSAHPVSHARPALISFEDRADPVSRLH
jgi:hypothetical protein